MINFSDPTPDRSTTPAKGHTRKEELTQTVPLEKTVALQKPNVHFLLDDLREPRAANALDEPVIAALQYMLNRRNHPVWKHQHSLEAPTL